MNKDLILRQNNKAVKQLVKHGNVMTKSCSPERLIFCQDNQAKGGGHTWLSFSSTSTNWHH